MIQSILRAFLPAFSWFVIVAPWEQAVRVRLGKHVQLLGAGVALKIPVVDRVFRQSTRERRSVIRPQVVTTTDGQAITVSGALGYRVDDLLKLYDTLEAPEDTLEAMVSGSVADFISARTKDECEPKALEEYVSERLELERYGLGGGSFHVVNLVAVKTYRFITGEIPSWSHGSGLQMEESGGGQVVGYPY